MRHTSYLGRIALTGWALLVSSIVGRAQERQDTAVVAGPKSPDAPCSASFDNTNKIMLGAFDDDISLRCQVGCPTGSTLIFANSSQRVLLSYRDEDELIHLSQIGTFSHLVLTVWSGGSHIAVRVFLVEQNSVSLVLNEATKMYPDVLTGPGGETAVIISRSAKGDPSRIITISDIYIYREHRLRLAETVKSNQRFRAAAKLMRP